MAVAVPLWTQRNGEDLPGTGIKESHALAKFLATLFGHLEIDSSPTKAYDAWLEQKQASPLREK